MAELETGALNERAHADEGRAVQGLQTHPGEHAIAPAKRHDVRDRRERAELQQLVLPQAVREIAEQTLREHEGHARTRELLVDRRIAGTPWVDERVRVRELARRGRWPSRRRRGRGRRAPAPRARGYHPVHPRPSWA